MSFGANLVYALRSRFMRKGYIVLRGRIAYRCDARCEMCFMGLGLGGGGFGGGEQGVGYLVLCSCCY